MGERIHMSNKDLERLEILTNVKERRLKQSKAAQMLGISPRQLRRVLRRFKTEGPKGVVSRKVGAKSNHRLSQAKKALVVDFFRNPDHYDFGPTLTQEYLIANGAPKISVTAIRNVMVENGLWHPKEIRKLNVHPLRLRRAKMGELIHRKGSSFSFSLNQCVARSPYRVSKRAIGFPILWGETQSLPFFCPRKNAPAFLGREVNLSGVSP